MVRKGTHYFINYACFYSKNATLSSNSYQKGYPIAK